MEQTIEQRLEEAMKEIREGVQLDGGDVRLVSFDEKTGIVEVELMGACVGCAFAPVTLKQGIEYMLKEQVPEVTEVVNVGQMEEDWDL
jgi:Fe-S cluster biogenesis protein NfuA